ncbi:hypothetical protein DTO96_102494 [Ephemeroptericola cinctiostellae]|uniref:Uncharacterized protein n=1 Tax=Ephemeroptericola cinctiostellae TaxID=2268024 RepID=A0A345DEF0_9BURK|nr:hypothetical protein DTO96_102494 [Ephemeroptericola cinctiostellae]
MRKALKIVNGLSLFAIERNYIEMMRFWQIFLQVGEMMSKA